MWLDFDPYLGHEQAGRRPALVLSSERYNAASELMLACPITSRARGSRLEVELPPGLRVQGVILTHHVRALSWPQRHCDFIEAAPPEVLAAVTDMLIQLLETP